MQCIISETATWKVVQYDSAVKSYIEALKQDPGDEDAKYNLSYALRKMKDQKQKNQQQKQARSESNSRRNNRNSRTTRTRARIRTRNENQGPTAKESESIRATAG
jgi:tetratricopeptide (TPR) repeat protein